jgi:hypothetical protein
MFWSGRFSRQGAFRAVFPAAKRAGKTAGKTGFAERNSLGVYEKVTLEGGKQ